MQQIWKREREFPLFNLETLESIMDKFEAIVGSCLEDAALAQCFLVDIVQSGTKVQVFIDTDEGVSFGECQKLSRLIEAELDESLLLGEKYTLEVSSPGVSRPLKFIRQFPRNVGREIELEMEDGSKIKGLLTEVKDNTLLVESKGKKKKEIINHEIIFDAVKSAKILISFGKQKMKK